MISAILSIVYIWRRNIAGCIALHWLIDGFGLLLARVRHDQIVAGAIGSLVKRYGEGGALSFICNYL